MPPSPIRASGGMLAFHSEIGYGSLRRESFFDPPNAVTFADSSRTLRELPLRVEDASEFRMPGEFEHQSGMMISCQAICSSDAIRDVIRAVARRVDVVALHADEEEYQTAHEALAKSGIPINTVHFAPVPHNTMWTRDYGPVVLASRRSRDVVVLDTQYREENRDDDDVVPLLVAEFVGLPVVDAQLNIEGGNVISNGQGLVITSTKLLDENPEIDKQTMSEALCMYYGATQVVFLEPLANESTGHVDMFATFASPNCLVLGEYDPLDDRENAAILQRNARRLSAVRLPQRKLQVRRIPMPSNVDGVWRTYTNVVYANGVLLMPIYSETNVDIEQKAIAVYRASLPGWNVTTINSDDLIGAGGALHCAIMNLGPLSADRIGVGRSRPYPRRMAQRR